MLSPHTLWHPTKPPSKGATAYHDAVINASWHFDNIKGFLEFVSKKIKKDDIVVDFGAVTGGSGIYFLEHIKKTFTLWLIDNSPSWLGKAQEILNHKPNVMFSILEKIEDRYVLLHEIIGEKSAHHVVSANTVHLIPPLRETFGGIFPDFKKKRTRH